MEDNEKPDCGLCAVGDLIYTIIWEEDGPPGYCWICSNCGAWYDSYPGGGME